MVTRSKLPGRLDTDSVVLHRSLEMPGVAADAVHKPVEHLKGRVGFGVAATFGPCRHGHARSGAVLPTPAVGATNWSSTGHSPDCVLTEFVAPAAEWGWTETPLEGWLGSRLARDTAKLAGYVVKSLAFVLP